MSSEVHVAPVVIQVLIAVHCQPRSAWPFDATAPSYKMSLRKLSSDGIIQCTGTSGVEEYTLTDRGRAWLETILSTPYPVAKWVDPRFGVL